MSELAYKLPVFGVVLKSFVSELSGFRRYTREFEQLRGRVRARKQQVHATTGKEAPG